MGAHRAQNQEGLVEFVEGRGYHITNIWMYSGHTWDQLTEGKMAHEYADRILSCIDVLVDGPWVQSLYDITLRFRGSSNQRLDVLKH